MNYRTYQTLTPEQKEEYNWRFKDEIAYNSKGMLWMILLLLTSLANYMFIIYLSIKDPLFESYKKLIMNIFLQSSYLTLVTGMVIVIFTITYLIRIIFRYYQYSRWLRENNIKIIYWWNR